MKKQLSVILLIIVSLAAVLLNLSCSGTPQNNTVGGTAINGSAAPSDTTKSAATLVADPCAGNPPNKLEKIKEKVKDNIEDDDRLNRQYNKSFFFGADMGTNGDAILYFWGNIFITEKDDLDNLEKKYKDLFKKGCVTKVAFTPPPGNRTVSQQFLELSLCEHPNQICSDGTCKLDCDRKDGNANTFMNSNSNK